MKEIPLTQGKLAIVDDEDYEEINKYNWYFSDTGYAVSKITKSRKKRTTVRMHVVIMGKIDGLELDHISGDKLDNRRENLRHVTHQQNQRNQKTNRESTSSRYKGVSWDRAHKSWDSYIKIGGKLCRLGVYKSERDAAWVYNVWAESLFGEYARLNVLDG